MENSKSISSEQKETDLKATARGEHAEIKEVTKNLLRKLVKNVEAVKEEELEVFVDALVEAYREKRMISVVGVGRSGLVGKGFAMRLMHLGFNVSVIGETITPSLKKGEILLVISGSGGTDSPAGAADIAKKVGAKIMCFTSFPDSRIGKVSDIKVIVPGRVVAEDENVDYFSRQLLGIHEPLAPLGTLFELSTAIILDAVVARLMKILNIKEEDLKNKHANLEIESS